MKRIQIAITLCLLTLVQMAASAGNPARTKQLADQLFSQGSYHLAIEKYQEYLAESNSEDAYAYAQMGEACYRVRDYQNGAKWLRKAWDGAADVNTLTQLRLGQCLKMMGDYELAKVELKGFSRKYRGPNASTWKRIAGNELKGCQLAEKLAQNTLPMEVYNPGPAINGVNSEASPVFVNENEVLFASWKVDSLVKTSENPNKLPFKMRFYTAERNSNSETSWQPSVAWEQENIDDNQFLMGNGSFSPDGKRFFYTKCQFGDTQQMVCDIYVSELDEGTWGAGKKLGSGINDGSFNSSPAVGMDEKGVETLYFVSGRGGGNGGTDIYYAPMKKNGDFDQAMNCGKRINTAGDEVTPYYHIPDHKFYFSSNGQISIGGHDVFYTQGSGARWDKVKNMGLPLNSSVDDFDFVLDQTGEKGFIVSNRNGGAGLKGPNCCDDIWGFNYIIPPVFNLRAIVYEADDPDKTPLGDAVVVLNQRGASRSDTALTVGLDPVRFDLDTNRASWTLEGFYKDWAPGSAYWDNSNAAEDDSITVYIPVTPPPPPPPQNITVRLDGVYYELGKAELLEESYLALDSVYTIMKTFPSIKVELSSHTDCRASMKFNQDLSQRRSESCVNYLVQERGIDPNRLIAKGYGETQLLNECECEGAKVVPCTEEQHQLNRRTEFKVVGKVEGVEFGRKSYDTERLKRDLEKSGKREEYQKLKRKEELEKELEALMEVEEGEDLDPELEEKKKELEELEAEEKRRREEQEKERLETLEKAKKEVEESRKDPDAIRKEEREKRKKELEEKQKEIEANKPVDLGEIETFKASKKTKINEGVVEEAWVNGDQKNILIDRRARTITISLKEANKLLTAGQIGPAEISGGADLGLEAGEVGDGVVITIKKFQIGPKVREDVMVRVSATQEEDYKVGITPLKKWGTYVFGKGMKSIDWR